MATRITITVGVGFDKNGQRVTGEMVRALEASQKELVREFGGYSRTVNEGAWFNDEGNFVLEQSYTYTIISWNEYGEDLARLLALEFKKALNQEAVLFTAEPVTTAEFI